MSNIQFWRSNQMSDDSFLDLVKRTFGKTFTKGIDAKNWLIINGYYTSYPDIVTDGLVLYLDAANSSSFKGEPATNLLTSYTENVGTNDTIGFKSNQGTEIKYVPSLGRVTTHYTNIYNDYPNNSASCCPSLYNFGDITILPNTVYTYQIVFRTSTGYYHPNYMYHYEFNNSTGLTEYGLLHPSRVKELGNGWIHAWGTFTSQPTANRFVCYLFHYEYTTQNKVEVAKISLTQGSTIYEPQFLLDINGTRGTTYATGGGWCDLSGNGNHGELVNGPLFNSSNLGSVLFNGTNNYITLNNSTSLQITDNITIEIWVKINSSNIGNIKVIAHKYSGAGWEFLLSATGNFQLGGRNGDGTYYVCDSNVNISDNNFHLLTAIKSGTNWITYIDGVYKNTTTTPTSGNISTSGVLEIGREGPGYYPLMDMFIMKIYNKALSQSEITQNFNATKERFGL